MEYFFDTSAIVKIYHEEEGSKAVLPIYSGNDSILISELSKVEFFQQFIKNLEAMK